VTSLGFELRHRDSNSGLGIRTQSLGIRTQASGFELKPWDSYSGLGIRTQASRFELRTRDSSSGLGIRAQALGFELTNYNMTIDYVFISRLGLKKLDIVLNEIF
jgi:hypothetical protein